MLVFMSLANYLSGGEKRIYGRESECMVRQTDYNLPLFCRSKYGDCSRFCCFFIISIAHTQTGSIAFSLYCYIVPVTENFPRHD